MKKLFAVLFALHLMIVPMQAHAMMGQVTGIAVASVGVTLATACAPITPSIGLYMAGAAAYLMAEMEGAKALKKQLKEKEDATKKLQEDKNAGGETQLASLKAQLKSMEEEKAHGKKRATWAMAAFAALTAAAITSQIEIPPFFPVIVCNGATSSVQGMAIGAGVVAAYTFIGGQGIMGALMGAVGGAVAASSMAINAFSGPGTTRGIAMGATALFVLLAAREASKKADDLQVKIDDLKKVIAQFEAETNGKGPNTEDVIAGTSAGSSGGVTSGSSGGATSGSAGGAAGGRTGTPVALLPTGRTTTGTTTCLSANREFTSNCSNPMKFTAPDLKMFGNQPEVQQVANQSAQFANAAASGDTGKADLAAASLSSMAGRMSDLLKKNRDAANKKLIAAGKKPIDYEKETQDMLKSMQSAYQKDTASKQAQLAAFGLDSMSLDPSKVDGSGQNINAASTAATIAVPTSDAKAQDAVAANADLAAAPIPPADLKAEESAASALGNNLGDYETNTGEISANKEDSLWKQVSNRYLLNYGKLFERKNVPAQ